MGVRHLDCRFLLYHQLGNPGEVEDVRPYGDGHAHHRRLQQIVAADRDQATPDEGRVPRGEEGRQLPHGIAEEHGDLLVAGVPGGSAREREPPALDQRRDPLEALGMAWHQDQ